MQWIMPFMQYVSGVCRLQSVVANAVHWPVMSGSSALMVI